MPEELGYYGEWLSLPDVRRSLHVGNLTYNDGSKVEQFLLNDMMQSVKPQLTQAMNYYKVHRTVHAIIHSFNVHFLC